MTRQLLKGNSAMAEAAIRAGLNAYFGYPITPQTEILEEMAKRMPELGRVFLQAESEVAAINMLYGAACTGARVMGSSSSPGISLMTEGLSYIAGTEVPIVLVDVMRGGPGLGNIAPSQGDYNQIVHGGGHGDFHPIVLAPSTVQEAIDLVGLSFGLAEKYRTIVVVLADGLLGQMMEPATLPPMQPPKSAFPDWAVGRLPSLERRVLSSHYQKPEDEEAVNRRLLERWFEVEEHETRCTGCFLEDADLVVVGFGTAGRISLTAVREARAEGLRVGLFRPISLSPFPTREIRELSPNAKGFLVVEMNSGQMLDDVRLAVGDGKPIAFYGRMGGVVPFPDEILREIHRVWSDPTRSSGDPRRTWIEHYASDSD